MKANQLLLAAIKTTSIEKLTKLLAEYLDQAVFIVTQKGTIIGQSGSPLPDFDSLWLQPQTNQGSFRFKQTEYLRRPINAFALNTWYLFVSQTKGYPVADEQLELVIQVVNTFNERYSVNPNQSAMNSLFAQLLADPQNTDTQLFTALTQQPLVAVRVTASRGLNHRQELRMAIQHEFPSAPITEDAKQALVLVLPAATAKFENTTLTHLAAKYQAVIFISEPYQEIAKTGEFLQICQQALQVATALNQTQSLNLTQEYNIYIILNHLRDLRLLRNTMCTQLLTLKSYDQKHHTELFKTLFVYLEADCRLGTTAEQLHLHRNSLSKRLAHIDDLIHLDFEQPHKTFGLRLSYRIINFLDQRETI